MEVRVLAEPQRYNATPNGCPLVPELGKNLRVSVSAIPIVTRTLPSEDHNFSNRWEAINKRRNSCDRVKPSKRRYETAIPAGSLSPPREANRHSKLAYPAGLQQFHREEICAARPTKSTMSGIKLHANRSTGCPRVNRQTAESTPIQATAIHPHAAPSINNINIYGSIRRNPQSGSALHGFILFPPT